MKFLNIYYEGGGFVKVDPNFVSYVRYFPTEKGRVTFYLKNGKSIDIYSCSDEDAKDYANRWKTALEDSQGQISEIPLLVGDKNDET